MKLLIFILFFVSALFADAYTLKNTYIYSDNTFYARNFFPHIRDDFAVLTIPEHLTHFSVAQHRIYNIFEAKGIKLAGKPSGLVHFRREMTLDLSQLEKEIFNYYSKALPFLTINSISINSKVNISRFPENYTMEMKKQAYKNNRGTVKLITAENRYFFDYTVDATFSQFQTAQTLHKGNLITASNTKLAIVPFRSYHNALIGFEDLGNIRVRKYIKMGKPIYQRDVEVLPLVQKGSVVNVKVIEGNILINFTATAQNDGALNDIITIKKSDGIRRKAKVVGLHKVVLE